MKTSSKRSWRFGLWGIVLRGGFWTRLGLPLVVVAVSAGPAVAGLSAMGEPQPSNSWTQEFQLTDEWLILNWVDPAGFDKMTIEMTTGQLKAPAMSSVTNVSDHFEIVRNDDPVKVVAKGKDEQDVRFALHFEGSMGDPVSFDLKVYDLLWCNYWTTGWAKAIWNGGKWAVCDCSADLEPICVPVPLPGAVLMGALGLATAGTRLRRFMGS